MGRKGRVNVEYNELKIIESIAKNEPYGRHTMNIAKDTGLHRDTVSRRCKQLEKDDYIFRKNKQSGYHVTNKIYGYPELTALSFGREAIRTICDNIRRGWIISSPNEFCINETCKKILRSNNNGNNAFEAKRDQEILREFATRLGAIIEYIMIQALSPKKIIFPNREEEKLVDLDVHHMKGKDKDDISRKWVEKAVKPIFILSEFSRLPIVKRGLAIFADKGETIRIDPSLPPKHQKNLIEKIKKMRQMDIDDPYWSPHEMDKENFKKLTNAFGNAFPEINEKLDRLIKKERARITQVEKGRSASYKVKWKIGSC